MWVTIAMLSVFIVLFSFGSALRRYRCSLCVCVFGMFKGDFCFGKLSCFLIMFVALKSKLVSSPKTGLGGIF